MDRTAGRERLPCPGELCTANGPPEAQRDPAAWLQHCSHEGKMKKEGPGHDWAETQVF